MSDSSSETSTSSSKHSEPVNIRNTPVFDDIVMSPPDNSDMGGLVNVSSLFHHRKHGSDSELAVIQSSDNPAPTGAHAPVNKLLNIESYPPSNIKKNYSMSTIPEFASFVSQVIDRGIGVGDHSNPPAFMITDADPEQLLLHTHGHFPLTRAMSADQLPKLDKKATLSPEISKFKPASGNTSPHVTHRDLNQFAPLHF